jgi:2-dehydro-3-deoxyglucarate aldolase
MDILPDIFRAIEVGKAVPFARVAQNHPKDIKQALDAGTRGIIVPMVESAEDVINFNKWVKYPPDGNRGVGFSRANLFGKQFTDYVSTINQQIIMVAQIEHINAVSNLDEILALKFLDAIMVGPYDLSGSMNLTAQFDHPKFQDALDTIFQKAREYKTPMGLHIVQPEPELLAEKILEGYQFIAYGIDAVFLYNSAIPPQNEKKGDT